MSETEDSEQEPRWEAVGKADEFPDNHGRAVEIGARPVAVFKHNDRFFALKDLCPHAGLPLHDGYIADGCVTCPWHGWVFELESGEGPGGCKVRNYPVRITDDGTVEVGV